MRVEIYQNQRTFDEFVFDIPRISVGRHPDSEIFLPDRAVSKKHAMFFKDKDGNWFVEDLGSVNKTYLNGKAVKRAPLKRGDIVRISDFELRIFPRESTEAKTEVFSVADDTVAAPAVELRTIERSINGLAGPYIKIASQRTGQYVEAISRLSSASDVHEFLETFSEILFDTFDCGRIWSACRFIPSGNMTNHVARCSDGSPLCFTDLEFKAKIIEAIEDCKFLLVTSDSGVKAESCTSALVAPFVHKEGVLGVVYLDNAGKNISYSPEDIDYLMLLSIYAGSMVKDFVPVVK